MLNFIRDGNEEWYALFLVKVKKILPPLSTVVFNKGLLQQQRAYNSQVANFFIRTLLIGKSNYKSEKNVKRILSRSGRRIVIRDVFLFPRIN